MAMNVSIRVEECVGETRAAAFAEDARPFALFLGREHIEPAFASWGEVHNARLTRIAPQQGGGFAELVTGEQVFLRTSVLKGRSEGERFPVSIEAERRNGKVARARIAGQPKITGRGVDAWIKALPAGDAAEIIHVQPGDQQISAAFSDAVSPTVTLAGGGTLHLSETPAIIAIDIDTAGRADSGRAYDRALKINCVAAEEAARQMSLRGLGGCMVLDCVNPLRKDLGAKIKQSFLSAFRSFSSRKVEALAPSPFGLMEAVAAWRRTPVSHALLGEDGSPTRMTELLEDLRSLERELSTDRAGSYGLILAGTLSLEWSRIQTSIEHKLIDRYGARFEIKSSENSVSQVRKT